MVARIITDLDWLLREPFIVQREAFALQIASGGGLPVPRVWAADPFGNTMGWPVIVTSRLHGTLLAGLAQNPDLLLASALSLCKLHALTVDEDHQAWIKPYQPHDLHKTTLRPAWCIETSWWDRAEELYRTAPPLGPTLLHRDYQPANILVHNAHISGIIDWTDASVGKHWADVGHFRINLLLRWSLGAAAAFLRIYCLIIDAREPYDPIWDIYAAMGMLHHLADLDTRQVQDLRYFIGSAVDAHGN